MKIIYGEFDIIYIIIGISYFGFRTSTNIYSLIVFVVIYQIYLFFRYYFDEITESIEMKISYFELF